MYSPDAKMVNKLNKVYSRPDGRFVAELETSDGQLVLFEDYSYVLLYDRVCIEMLHLATGTKQVNVKFMQLLVRSASALKKYQQRLSSNAA